MKNAKRNDEKNKKFGKKSRGNSRNRRNDSEDSKRDSAARGSFPVAAGQNDVMWYAANEQLLRDTSSYPYSYAVGTPIDIYPSWDQTRLIYAVPGVMAFHTYNTPGYANDGSDPINVAAKNIYSYVRHANSGHSNYESNDLMIYLMVMDSVYTLIAHAKRLYGVARCYSQVNRYYPEAIITAMGFDPQDVIANLPSLRYAINSAIVKAGSLAVPNSMPLFHRHAEQLYSNIYTDTVSGAKCQSYLFVPSVIYTFDAIGSESGGRALAQRLDYENLMTVEDLIVMFNDQINSLIVDEDINIMSGDILKAFGAENLLKMAGVSEDYLVMPVFNPEVMMQINNLSLHNVYDAQGNDVCNIEQSNGDIIFRPYTNLLNVGQLDGRYFEDHKWIVNMPVENPLPGDTMVATRCLSAFDSNDRVVEVDNKLLGKLSVFGSEIVEMAWVYRYQYNSDGSVARELVSNGFNSHVYVNPDVLPETLLSFNMLMNLSAFDNRPRIYWAGNFKISESDRPTAMPTTYGDINTYTLLDVSSLRRMHATALMSELDVPVMGVWARK